MSDAEESGISLRVTMLGTGTSHGVPAIGCDCAVCRSTDPRDKRTRPSILIDLGERSSAPPIARAVRYILIDTATDLRAQALANDVRRVDAILFTHAHADHIFGIDEVRRYNALQRGFIPCFADAATLADLQRMFAYIFTPPPSTGGGVPQLKPFPLVGPFTLGGVEFVPVPVMHGPWPVLGFRIGAFAYITDCNVIPDSSWPLLDGVRTIVLDALRERRHSTHFSVSEALEVVSRLSPERAYFTHIAHDLGHAATCARLPAGVELAYDGQVLEIA